MKKSIKILAGITAFLLIGGILLFANGFLGNPISKMLANHTAKKYIEENYDKEKLNISEITYNFKDGNYNAHIKSPTSKDTYFDLSISPLGKLEHDSYKDNVEEKYNTYTRLNKEYNSKVEEVFENKKFPYKSDIAFGEIKDISSQEVENENNGYSPIYGIKLSDLELDKNYNMNKIGKKYGHIIFYAEDEDVSIKRASEILLDIKNILDENEISFYAIDFTLEKPIKEDGKNNSNNKSIYVNDFLYSDINENNLEKKVKENYEKLLKYYNEQDKLKD